MTSSGHIHFNFENGYTVSIFNGFGSYTENHFNMEYHDSERNQEVRSKHVEIAIIKNGMFVTNGILHNGDQIKEMVSIEELMEILNKVKELNGE